RLARMDLHLPDPLALLEAGHLEADVRADAPLEGGIEVRREVRGEDDDAVELLELAQEDVDGDVRLAHVREAAARGAARRDRVGFVEEEDRVLLRGRAKPS